MVASVCGSTCLCSACLPACTPACLPWSRGSCLNADLAIACLANSSIHRCTCLQVAHILVAPEKKDLIPQLRQRIEAGEASMAALAAEHSQCPSRR